MSAPESRVLSADPVSRAMTAHVSKCAHMVEELVTLEKVVLDSRKRADAILAKRKQQWRKGRGGNVVNEGVAGAGAAGAEADGLSSLCKMRQAVTCTCISALELITMRPAGMTATDDAMTRVMTRIMLSALALLELGHKFEGWALLHDVLRIHDPSVEKCAATPGFAEVLHMAIAEAHVYPVMARNAIGITYMIARRFPGTGSCINKSILGALIHLLTGSVPLGGELQLTTCEAISCLLCGRPEFVENAFTLGLPTWLSALCWAGVDRCCRGDGKKATVGAGAGAGAAAAAGAGVVNAGSGGPAKVSPETGRVPPFPLTSVCDVCYPVTTVTPSGAGLADVEFGLRSIRLHFVHSASIDSFQYPRQTWVAIIEAILLQWARACVAAATKAPKLKTRGPETLSRACFVDVDKWLLGEFVPACASSCTFLCKKLVAKHNAAAIDSVRHGVYANVEKESSARSDGGLEPDNALCAVEVTLYEHAAMLLFVCDTCPRGAEAVADVLCGKASDFTVALMYMEYVCNVNADTRCAGMLARVLHVCLLRRTDFWTQCGCSKGMIVSVVQGIVSVFANPAPGMTLVEMHSDASPAPSRYDFLVSREHVGTVAASASRMMFRHTLSPVDSGSTTAVTRFLISKVQWDAGVRTSSDDPVPVISLFARARKMRCTFLLSALFHVLRMGLHEKMPALTGAVLVPGPPLSAAAVNDAREVSAFLKNSAEMAQFWTVVTYALEKKEWQGLGDVYDWRRLLDRNGVDVDLVMPHVMPSTFPLTTMWRYDRVAQFGCADQETDDHATSFFWALMAFMAKHEYMPPNVMRVMYQGAQCTLGSLVLHLKTVNESDGKKIGEGDEGVVDGRFECSSDVPWLKNEASIAFQARGMTLFNCMLVFICGFLQTERPDACGGETDGGDGGDGTAAQIMHELTKLAPCPLARCVAHTLAKTFPSLDIQRCKTEHADDTHDAAHDAVVTTV